MSSGAFAPPNLLSEWSRLLFGRLVAAGVRRAVISPGSRSTPFAWAALHTDGLTCHSVYDERDAGFYALGTARLSGRPALLLCTSGSAAAHYFPAVIEAALARVPLLVLTADRPLELADASAAQTIDQTRLFGDFARRFYELGGPDPSPSALDGLSRLAEQAYFHALHPEPGPVQLNARARKPLEPAAAEDELAERLQAAVSERLSLAPRGALPAELHAPDAAVQRLAAVCGGDRRGVIVCGPRGPHEPPSGALRALAHASGFPLAGEATSQERFAPGEPCLDALDWLLRTRRLADAVRPEVMLHFGPPATSSALERLLASGVEYHIVARHGFPDPTGRARSLTIGDTDDVAARLARALSGAPGPRGQRYAAGLSEQNRAAWRAVDTVLERAPALREGAAVRSAVCALPRGSLLALGNSLPVREVDQYVPAGDRGLTVLHQRGANGIDGAISHAAGAALEWQGPTLLLLGDVTFLHDLGGLELARRAERPFVLVVADNGGGRIFEQLPLAPRFAARPELARFWLTPHASELVHAARLFGVPYRAPETATELARAVAEAAGQRGATLIHARVVPESAAEDAAAILDLLEAESSR